jgi:hypothetical protein
VVDRAGGVSTQADDAPSRIHAECAAVVVLGQRGVAVNGLVEGSTLGADVADGERPILPEFTLDLEGELFGEGTAEVGADDGARDEVGIGDDGSAASRLLQTDEGIGSASGQVDHVEEGESAADVEGDVDEGEVVSTGIAAADDGALVAREPSQGSGRFGQAVVESEARPPVIVVAFGDGRQAVAGITAGRGDDAVVDLFEAVNRVTRTFVPDAVGDSEAWDDAPLVLDEPEVVVVLVILESLAAGQGRVDGGGLGDVVHQILERVVD